MSLIIQIIGEQLKPGMTGKELESIASSIMKEKDVNRPLLDMVDSHLLFVYLLMMS